LGFMHVWVVCVT